MKTREKSLSQQYLLASSESDEFIKDFEPVDLEGWNIENYRILGWLRKEEVDISKIK